jgi:hypothetical protein
LAIGGDGAHMQGPELACPGETDISLARHEDRLQLHGDAIDGEALRLVDGLAPGELQGHLK